MRVPAAAPTACLLFVLLTAVAAPSPPSAAPDERQAPHAALSPERQGLRPDAALSGVPPALLERPDRLQDPAPHDLNATLLRARLGRDFDPRVLSVVRPRPMRRLRPLPHSYSVLDSEQDFLPDSDEDFPFRRTQRGRLVPAGDMPESIAVMDFRGVRLPDGTWLRTHISPRLKRKLQNYLWAYTACPVSWRWRDLGLRFWPRWLKEGHCPAAPCSIPPGMRCRPAATRHQALLRWHCRQHRHCSWIKVEYPVVTRCTCGCASDDRYS